MNKIIADRFTPPEEIRARYTKAYERVGESALKNFLRASARIVRPSDQREAAEGNLKITEHVAHGYANKYLPALEDQAAAEARVAGKEINLPFERE